MTRCIGRPAALLVLAAAAVLALDFEPLEIRDVPVNGTDARETPSYLHYGFGFELRSANKLVEHAGTPALEDDVRGIATPHYPWAENYREGPVSVLWLADPRYGLRAPLEIQQRSNFAVTLLMIPQDLADNPLDSGLNQWFARHYDDILGRDYDVIVLSGWGGKVWRKNDDHPLLRSVYDRIEAKVRAGESGLVCKMGMSNWHQANREDVATYHRLSPITYGHAPVALQPARTEVASPVSAGISFAAWPRCLVSQTTADEGAVVLAQAADRPMVALGEYGKGRVVAIHCITPFYGQVGVVPELPADSEAVFGDASEAVYPLWLRAIAWAAGKPPTVGIEAPERVACAAGAKPAVAVTVTGAPAGTTLEYRLSDAYADRLATGAVAVPAGPEPAAVSLDLPALHANGVYRVDLRLRAADRTLNWGTVGIAVADGPRLAVERLDAPTRPGETLRFRVKTGVPGRLRVQAVDDIDRLWHDRTAPVTDGDVLTLDTTLSKLPRNRVFFTLLGDDDTVLARTAAQVYLPRVGLAATEGQFLIAAYGHTYASAPLEAHAGALYRAAGFDTLYFNWHNPKYMKIAADYGLGCIAGRSWMMKQNNFEKIHQMSPNIPANRENWRRNIEEFGQAANSYGAIARVLDEEHCFAYTARVGGELRGAQISQDQWSLELFRAAMKEKYGDIAALNEMWGTDFADFAAVRVIEEDEIDIDNPSGWLEFREYMNWTFANRYYGWLRDQHRELVDPSFGAGPGAPNWRTNEGGPTYRGGDLGLLAGNVDFMTLYGGGSPGFATILQPGGQKYEPPKAWTDFGPWRHVLTGADGLWFYYADALIGSELAWRRHTLWMREGIADIVAGAGSLLSGATPTNDGVRILSTSQNQHMGWLFAKRDDAWSTLRLAGGAPRSAGTFREMLNLLFVRSGGISEAHIVAGGLADCRLLILPQQLNLGDEAAAAIRAWVRDGGTVVADILPATRHQVGKPRDNSALADVFGVDFGAAELHREAEAWYAVGIRSPAEAETSFSRDIIWLTMDVCCRGLKPTTATAHARIYSKEGQETPGCFINQYGQGQALLLNFIYRDVNTESMGWHRIFGAALMAWAGLDPAVRIVDPHTREPLPYRQLYTLWRGEATLLGALRGKMIWSGISPVLVDEGRALSMTDGALFTWTGKQHVYDVRAGRYLGHGEEAAIDLPSFEARLLCLLPYQVRAVDLEAPERATAGAMTEVRAAVRTVAGTPGEHVIRFTVTSPTGAERPLYARTETAAAGHAVCRIPFALNDPPGDWTVTARDAMTGVSASTRIRLGRD